MFLRTCQPPRLRSRAAPRGSAEAYRHAHRHGAAATRRHACRRRRSRFRFRTDIARALRSQCRISRTHCSTEISRSRTHKFRRRDREESLRRKQRRRRPPAGSRRQTLRDHPAQRKERRDADRSRDRTGDFADTGISQPCLRTLRTRERIPRARQTHIRMAVVRSHNHSRPTRDG